MPKIEGYRFLESTQNERLGSSRLMLIETFMLIIKNDKMNKYSIFDKIDDNLWHLLLVWFNEALHNSIFQKYFFEIVILMIKHGNEKILLKFFFKLEGMSILHKTYKQIYMNRVLLSILRIKDLYFNLDKIVKTLKTMSHAKMVIFP